MKIRKIECLILMVALVLRLFLAFNAQWLPLSDSRDYHVLAENVLAGRGYQQLYQGESPEYQGLTFYAYRMPGYPISLVFWYGIFGFHPLIAYLANVFYALVSQLLLIAICQRFLTPRASIIAQVCLALHVLWCPNLMTEELFAVLFLATIYLILVPASQFMLRRVATFGCLLALAVMVRPIALVLVPFGLLKINYSAGAWSAAKSVAAMFLPLLLFISIWSYRNYTHLGQLVLFSTNFGAHNAPDFGIDKRAVILQNRKNASNEALINQQLTAEIINRIQSNPKAALYTYCKRMLGLFDLVPVWEVRGLLWQRTFQHSRRARVAGNLHKALYWQYYLSFPLALLGAVLAIIKRERVASLLAVALAYVLFHGLISNGNIRFVSPLYPIMCIFVGLLVDRLSIKLRVVNGSL